jgi:hypothetical protein
LIALEIGPFILKISVVFIYFIAQGDKIVNDLPGWTGLTTRPIATSGDCHT